MAKNNQGPTNLSEAIENLEYAGESKLKDFKEILEKDYDKVRQNLDQLKPFLDDLKTNVKVEVKKTKNQVSSI